MHIDVIIPALNEESAITHVIRDLPRHLVREIVVCDNGSTDHTAQRARMAGAHVIHESRRGYGNACLAGIEYLSRQAAPPDIVIFIDGDYSDDPSELPSLLHPIMDQNYDLVIGSRTLGKAARGSLTPQQIIGNALATYLIRLLYGLRFTDLGPFRAIRWDALQRINMQDTSYGWTVEMQVKAAKHQLRCTEVPVRYRKRIGQSKISGTFKGSVLAGYKILTTIFKWA